MAELLVPSSPSMEASAVAWARSVERNSTYMDVDSVPPGGSTSTAAGTAKIDDTSSKPMNAVPQHDSAMTWHCSGAAELALVEAA